MAIMFFLYILASLYILQYTINSYLSSNSDFVLINAKKTDTIEHTVRHALKKYPTREIYIVNKSHDSEMVKILSHEGVVFGIEPPIFVELEVTETEPGFKGNTATGATKPAIVETGASVNVPLFINQNEVIRIDTRTGEYLGRAKE